MEDSKSNSTIQSYIGDISGFLKYLLKKINSIGSFNNFLIGKGSGSSMNL